jgi:UDP-N-acetylglucosamine 2-epimerase (non-hydrolysing)
MHIARKVLVVFGTRPEAIKMAPVVASLRESAEIETRVCVTGQHREMLDQVLDLFKIEPDFDLNLMSAGQSLSALSARLLEAVSGLLATWEPELVLVHGDTTTTAMTSTACFYQRIAVGHVEAGLRTGDLMSPWPEEFNRRLAGLVSRLHFAPTVQARDNLLREGVPESWVHVTGNTVIDSLLQVAGRLDADEALSRALDKRFSFLNPTKRVVLVTGHRRENFGDGMRSICAALRALSRRGDIEIVYPVHRNPNVRAPVEQMLAQQPNIHLIDPQDYLTFVYLMKRCTVLLTDSGGVQEEAPSLGKPVLVMRDATERPEAIEAGTVELVGTDAGRIERRVSDLLDDEGLYSAMVGRPNPFGDGKAAARIISAVSAYLGQLP